MNTSHPFRFPRPLLLFLPLLLPQFVDATGFEEPLRWTQQAEKPQVLEAPEFYFALEMKRLAAELHPNLKALPPPLGANSEADYSKQTAVAELADFEDALTQKRIAPPDPAAARAAHLAMRSAIDGTQPAKDAKPDRAAPATPGEEFASEFADYHRGALAFHAGDLDGAEKAWTELLARPAAERHYRTTWAMYMLGKMAGTSDEAREWFKKTRQAVKDGFADTPGLAATSLGWEGDAELAGGHPSAAAHLYLEQLATGDESGVDSLRAVLDQVFKEDVELDEAVRDPVLQRLGTAAAVAGIGPFFMEEEGKEPLATKWLHALEKIDAKQVRDADRIAWNCYSHGEYAKAERWLARADAGAPYALWLRAKLALRAGKVDAATPLLAQAVAKIAPEQSAELESRSHPPTPEVALADLGALRLSRGEFLAALRLFVDAQMDGDALYLADGVLTIEELKAFIQRELPGPPKAVEGQAEPDTATTDWRHGQARADFRGVLAHRLVRAERYAEARSFLEPPAQGELDEYVAQLNAAKKPHASKEEQSDALWKAAQLMLEHGADLVDYYDSLTMAQRVSGRMVETGPYPVIALKYGKPAKLFPPLSKAEQERLKKNSTPGLHRNYSIYLAADLGWRAAALMPDNDEDTAETLNSAGSWLKNGDDGAADRFYQAIERRCPKTDLGKIAIKRHWFVRDDELPPPAKEN